MQILLILLGLRYLISLSVNLFRKKKIEWKRPPIFQPFLSFFFLSYFFTSLALSFLLPFFLSFM